MKWLRPSAIVYALISFYNKHLSAVEQSIAFVLTINHTNKSVKAYHAFTLQLFRKPEPNIMENR